VRSSQEDKELTMKILRIAKIMSFVVTAWVSANLFILYLRGSIQYSDSVGVVSNPSDHGAIFFLTGGLVLVLGNAWLMKPNSTNKGIDGAKPTLLESAKLGIEERFGFWALVSAGLTLGFALLLFVSIRRGGQYTRLMDGLWSLWH